MYHRPLLAFLFALLSATATAQQAGEVLSPPASMDALGSGVTVVGARGTCGTGSTTTTFSGSVGQAGNMFDIAPTVDMEIDCVDMNMGGSGPVDMEFWYCANTAVGNGQNPSAWTQFASATGVIPAGRGNATNIDISGNGMVFSAGATYGIYIFVQNYVGSSVGIVWYDSPGTYSTYTGDHCSVTTLYASQMNWQYLYDPRDWNGTLYTEVAAPTGPTLAVTGTCPGSMTATASNLTPGGLVALYYGLPTGSTTLPSGACAGLTLPVSSPTQLGPFRTADAAGGLSLARSVGAGLCGLATVGVVDITTCTTTNVVTL